MKKFLAFTGLLLVSSVTANGQIDPLYAQYLNNPLSINPAYTGFTRDFNASITYRKQWAGFDGSPETINASVHSSVLDNKMGVGLMIVQDNIGINKNTEVQATYAYRLDLDEKILSFGLQAGVVSYANNYSDLNPQDPGAPEFASNQTYTKPSFGAGLMLTSDRFLLAMSVPRILKNSADFGNGETQLYQQHYYLTGAYVFFLNERVRLKPSMLFKAVSGAPISIDYNIGLNIDERYTAGLYTRNLKSFGLLTQIKLDHYRLGYAFEVPANNSMETRFTTHEISIGINLSLLGFHDPTVQSF
jgi:type IX secretion system PorP/SprF family membrane protein